MPAIQPVCTFISHGCAKSEITDERGNPCQGRRLGKREYDEHCRADKRLKYLVRICTVGVKIFLSYALGKQYS